MREPLAFFLTWTCYGAWLHGDARGCVDRSHRTPGTAFAAPSPARRAGVRRQMKGDAFTLSPAARRVVDAAIRRHCAHRDWWLGAANVRSNHVHCVVASPGVRPERVVQELKSWATRDLRAEGFASPDARIWTRHASTKPLWNRADVQSAMRYVIEGQEGPWKRGAPEMR